MRRFGLMHWAPILALGVFLTGPACANAQSAPQSPQKSVMFTLFGCDMSFAHGHANAWGHGATYHAPGSDSTTRTNGANEVYYRVVPTPTP